VNSGQIGGSNSLWLLSNRRIAVLVALIFLSNSAAGQISAFGSCLLLHWYLVRVITLKNDIGGRKQFNLEGLVRFYWIVKDYRTELVCRFEKLLQRKLWIIRRPFI